MYDINFYRRYFEQQPKTLEEINELRSKTPVVFGIETTNNCNKECFFCPRGRGEMTRSIRTMDSATIEKIIPYLRPWSSSEWAVWRDFIGQNFSYVSSEEQTEDNFYLYILPRVLVLHGWGEPLLDRTLGDKIKTLSNAELETYFSCNPENLVLEKGKRLCEKD